MQIWQRLKMNGRIFIIHGSFHFGWLVRNSGITVLQVARLNRRVLLQFNVMNVLLLFFCVCNSLLLWFYLLFCSFCSLFSLDKFEI